MSKKYRMERLKKLPAGKYYIGDLCYLQSKLKENSETYEVIDVIFYDDPSLKTGMNQDYETGICFYFTRDFGGDGTYATYVNGKHKLDLAVDSGSIAAITYPHASEFKSKRAKTPAGRRKTPDSFMKEYTLTHTFKEDFECGEKRGKGRQGPSVVLASGIGDVVIDFKGSKEE
jgi:hypothetical protein